MILKMNNYIYLFVIIYITLLDGIGRSLKSSAKKQSVLLKLKLMILLDSKSIILRFNLTKNEIAFSCSSFLLCSKFLYRGSKYIFDINISWSNNFNSLFSMDLGLSFAKVDSIRWKKKKSQIKNHDE